MRVLLLAAVVGLAMAGTVVAQAPEDAADVVLLRGAVTLNVVMGRGIAAAVDLPDDDTLVGDGVFDRLIVLEAFGRIPPELPLELRDAYVAYSAGRAQVVEIGGPRIFDFVVDEPMRRGGLDDGKTPATIRLERRWSGRDERMTFHGVGLVIAEVSTRTIDDGSWAGREPARASCSVGSTSCSVTCSCAATMSSTCATSCQTTCAAGYYACCQCQGAAVGAECSCLLSGGNGGGWGGGGGGGSGACSGGAGGCPAECFNCAY